MAVFFVGESPHYYCINISNKLHGISIQRLSRLYKHDPEKLQRIIEFNEFYGFGEEIFKEWLDKYNKFDIIFPKEYDISFKNILKNGKRYYKKYIDGKIDSDVKSFQVYITEFNYLYEKCMKFYEDKKDSKYILNKQIARFLKDQGKITTLSHLQDKEEITRDFAKYIYHNSFVNKFRIDIKNTFEKFNIKLTDIGEKDIKFTFKNKNYQPIELYSTLKNFVLKFSDIFYNINDFSKNDIITTLKISNSYTNVENFVSMLGYGLKRTGYYFKLDSELYEKQQIEVHRRGLKTFATLNLPEFLDEYKECLYLTEAAAKNVLLSKIENIDNWTDKSHKDKYNIGNIAEKFAR